MNEAYKKEFWDHFFHIHSSKYFKLTIETEKKAKQYLLYTFFELLTLSQIPKFLKEELNSELKEEDKIIKYTYHIENFSQRYYVFEEGIFNFLENLFQLKPKMETLNLTIKKKALERKSQIREFLKSKCCDVSTILEKFFEDPNIKKIRKERREIIHELNSNMIKDLVIYKWKTTSGSAEQKETYKIGLPIIYKKETKNELEKMEKTVVKIRRFFEDFVTTIDNYLQ